MKLRYLSIFVLLFSFMFSPLESFAITDSTDLKYDVTKMKVKEEGNEGKITFTGWARKVANNKGDHNIGGTNLKIFIAAVRKDEVDDYLINTIKNKIKNNPSETSFSDNRNRYYVVANTSYSNGNLLFGSLCYKECGNKCCEIPRYNSSSYEKPSLEPKYSSCGYNEGRPITNVATGVTCESYNTGFSISFKIKELKKKLIGSNDSVEVDFIIIIAHRPMKYSTIQNKYIYDGSWNTYARSLAVYNGVCSGCENSRVFNIDLTTSNKFRTEGTGLLVSNASGVAINPGGSYFEDKKVFTIEEKKALTAPDGNRGIKGTGGNKLYIYKIKTNRNSTTNGIYSPGNAGSYYAWASWGVIDGTTTVTLYKDGEEPVKCSQTNLSVNCNTSSSTPKVCDDYVSKTIPTKDPALKLNATCGKDAEIYVYKKYKVTETINVTPEYVDINGVPYPIATNNEIKIKSGRYFGFKLLVNSELTREWYTADTYYGVKFIYNDGENECKESIMYFTYTSLFRSGFLSNDTKTKIINADSGWTFNETDFSNFDDTDLNRNNFFDSNKLKEPTKNGIPMDASIEESEKIIKKASTTEIYDPYKPNAQIHRFYIEIQKPCLSGSGKVRYISKDETCYLDETDLSSPHSGNVYFVPIGFKKTATNPSLVLNLGGNKSYYGKFTYNLCDLVGDDDTKLNKRYRVIDLKEPFPNRKPGELVSGKTYASNWHEIWQDPSKFNEGNGEGIKYLYNRYINSIDNKMNAEKYEVNLSSDNIKYIRKFNLELKNIYNTEIYFGVDVEGAKINNVTYSGTPGAVSEFINDNLNNSLASSPGNIFKRKWTKFTVVGEKGVDS